MCGAVGVSLINTCLASPAFEIGLLVSDMAPLVLVHSEPGNRRARATVGATVHSLPALYDRPPWNWIRRGTAGSLLLSLAARALARDNAVMTEVACAPTVGADGGVDARLAHW